MARIRSPNYPQLSLGEAIELVRLIHEKEGRSYTEREAIAELLGYNTINGASERKISALTAYSLLERNEDRQLRVSDLALGILFPDDEGEARAALAVAARSPNLFMEIEAKWPNGPASNESLKSFLIRRGFNQNAVGSVIDVYRKTMSLVEDGDDMSESMPQQVEEPQKAPTMTPQHPTPSPPVPTSVTSKPILFDMETVMGTYRFDNADDLGDFIAKLERIKPMLPSKSNPSDS